MEINSKVNIQKLDQYILIVHQIILKVLNHRDLIIGHLIWVTIALGLHSFSIYIHNDTLQAFGRSDDIFGDNSIPLY